MITKIQRGSEGFFCSVWAIPFCRNLSQILYVRMEEREGTNNNTTSLNHQAAAAYPMDPPRPDNPNPFSAPPTTSSVGNAAPPFSLTMPTETASSEKQKKKRGRPRKYNPDGTLAVTLSPMPISSSVPLTSGLPPRKRGRGRGRSSQWLKKPEMFQFDRSPGIIMSLLLSMLCLFRTRNVAVLLVM